MTNTPPPAPTNTPTPAGLHVWPNPFNPAFAVGGFVKGLSGSHRGATDEYLYDIG